MNRRKKNWLLVLIYTVMILLCLGIVMIVGHLDTSRRSREETSGKHFEESSDQQQREEPTGEKEPINPETEASDEATEPETRREFKNKRKGRTVEEETSEETEEYKPPVVVVASDVHYYSPELTDYGEAFEEMQKRDDGKLVNYIPKLMDAFTAEMEGLKPSAVVLSGDLTLNGEKAGHEALAQKLEILEEKGVKVLVIPGNHDINNYASASYFGKEKEVADIVDPKGFYDIYRRFGYDQAISRDENSLSYVYELDEKNWLLMLDSAQYEPLNKVGGRIKQETLGWMKAQLEEAGKQGITVIPIAHHNLLKESILYPEDCTLENSQDVIALLESYRIPLYISGHLHLQRTKKYKPEPGESKDAYHISEVVADSFAISPCRYGVLQWTEDGRLVYTPRAMDVEGWARKEGITDENLLNFKEYGMKFLTEVISSQVSGKIKNLPEEQVVKMAELYGDINRAYCEGVPVDGTEVRSEEAFRLWQRNLPDSRMFAEIGKILKDTGHDHNTWECQLEIKE
ncbi:metallophosphoesterase [Lacrimispora saccharolytica]|uniref:Metallophosphoesterase n=1 Tax=Lacrimispora saccharolytica (strain ATCC 35040 / DSM 2544 / NRCC 2533 / WM1) TaxID=610130 RepID=D9R4E2_LACSW|nr:metallophosphoesterase [Lacrimispora saccharolytica]ADL05012.1 metallophosphoesterase [[Clostridium] saccharolyticum WM1]QRV20788.1 metallophosphoesterase [Lacrimispora saccharolytica]